MSDSAENARASTELGRIRELVTGRMTANPGDTTEDLVRRMMWISWGEGSASAWFDRWQQAHRMNARLTEALTGTLRLVATGKSVPDDTVSAMTALIEEARAPVFDRQVNE